jgi:hypothetical protein
MMRREHDHGDSIPCLTDHDVSLHDVTVSQTRYCMRTVFC